MARQYRAGRGSTEVVLSGHIEAMVENTLRNMMPTTKATIERHLGAIEASAIDRWPVGKSRKGSNHSREKMDSAVRILGPDEIDGIVRNNADYAYYIKTEQNGLDGKSPFQELIRKPLKAAEKDIAQAVADDLTALMNRGGR